MDHKKDAGRHARSLIAWLCVALLVAYGVSACSPHIPPRPLPELHMPGVSKVSGFENWFKAVGGYDILGHFTAYQPDGPGQPGHVLLPLGGKLYDIGLDGNAPRAIHTPTHALLDTCSDRPSVTSNSQWLLCSTTAGIIALDLHAPLADNLHVALANENRPQRPAFAPHNQSFVVNLFADKDCELGVYASAPPYNSSRFVEGLLFPDLVELGETWGDGYAHACDMTDVSWSPDGHWNAFIAGRPGADVKSHLYAVDVRTIGLPSEATTDPARVITVPSGAVHDLGPVVRVGGIWANLTWPNVPDTVSIPQGNKIISINLRTNERHVALSVEDAEFCWESWTPDGTQLFFALCRPWSGNPDIGSPPAQLYVYTP